ncbi:hypothetical protein [Bradyrhizobium sp. SYSU BS000235]|uniref:hypothetical protein n=1 Tax=Bradyrhizobium sp. SYSU BS000235 TaxID=3411332 RepID=UPI003C74AAE1
MTDITGPKIVVADKTARKHRRLERQLRALHAMQAHLNVKDIVCAILAIPALTLLCLTVALKLHMASESIPLAMLGAAAAGTLIWWIGRRWFILALLIVYALLLILFESADFDLSGLDVNSKRSRRDKLDAAIAKREAMLRELNRTTS